MDKTLKYYNEHASAFCENTQQVDFTETQDRFIELLPPGGRILDFGCGSGRDTLYFLQRGFQVDAVDGSEELCRIASAYTGIPVRQMLFQQLNAEDCYDGIWACASVLHLKKKELPDVLKRMSAALKIPGFLYTSFKYGTFEGLRGQRYFTDFTEESIRVLLDPFPDLMVADLWITSDVRSGRSGEKWLNLMLKKTELR